MVKIGKTIGAGVTALAGAALLATGITTAPLPEARQTEPAGDTVTAAVTYILRDWNGQLAVFRKGSGNPDMVYEDVPVAALPPEERQRLQEGVEVLSRAELNRLLEDYTS